MEIWDHTGWLWGLWLIVLTMAIHATAMVILAFAGVTIRVRLEARGLKMWSLIAILICVIGVIGLLLAVLHGMECVIWAAAYLWLGALNSPMDALLFSVELDEHARRIRADAATTLADDGRAGVRRRDAPVRCEHGVSFLGDAGVLVSAQIIRARLPWWQVQVIGDARRLYVVHDPRQAACLEFGDEQALGTAWQSVFVDAVDLAVTDDDAHKQFDEAFRQKPDRGRPVPLPVHRE